MLVVQNTTRTHVYVIVQYGTTEQSRMNVHVEVRWRRADRGGYAFGDWPRNVAVRANHASVLGQTISEGNSFDSSLRTD